LVSALHLQPHLPAPPHPPPHQQHALHPRLSYLILSTVAEYSRRVRTHSRNLFVIAMSSGPSRELGLSLGLMLRTSCLLFLVGDATGFVVLGTHRTIQGRPRGCVTPLMEFGDAFYSAAVPLQPAPTRPRSSNLRPIASAPAVPLEPTADRRCSHRTAPTGSGAHARTHTHSTHSDTVRRTRTRR
jgi:hypothetical protein